MNNINENFAAAVALTTVAEIAAARVENCLLYTSDAADE